MPIRAAAPSRAEAAPAGSLMRRARSSGSSPRLAAANPAPHTELVYADPFTLLVAVVLSAQATDVGVNKATTALFDAAPTPAAMVALGEERIREHIKTIGLFRNKARNVVALSRALLERHGGKVPRDRAALEALPGVGRKTANVVLNEAFGEPTIAVDTHVFRVANRTGLAPGKTPEAVEAELERVVPAEYKRGAHHWLILHGRYVCLARRPSCPSLRGRRSLPLSRRRPGRRSAPGHIHRRPLCGVRAQPVRRRSAASIRQDSIACACASTASARRISARSREPCGSSHEAQARQPGEMDIAGAAVEAGRPGCRRRLAAQRALVGPAQEVAKVMLPMRGGAPCVRLDP